LGTQRLNNQEKGKGVDWKIDKGEKTLEEKKPPTGALKDSFGGKRGILNGDTKKQRGITQVNESGRRIRLEKWGGEGVPNS